MSSASLLDVAAEIRIFIYRELFSKLRICLSERQAVPGTAACKNIDILFACRKTYHEARPILLSCSMFYTTLHDVKPSNGTSLNTLRPSVKHRIKRVTIIPSYEYELSTLRFAIGFDIAAFMRGKDEVHVRLPGPVINGAHSELTAENVTQVLRTLEQDLSNENSPEAGDVSEEEDSDDGADYVNQVLDNVDTEAEHNEEQGELNNESRVDPQPQDMNSEEQEHEEDAYKDEYADNDDADEDTDGFSVSPLAEDYLTLTRFIVQCDAVLNQPIDSTAMFDRQEDMAIGSNSYTGTPDGSRSPLPKLYIVLHRGWFCPATGHLRALERRGECVMKYNRDTHTLELQGSHKGSVSLPRLAAKQASDAIRDVPHSGT